MVRKKRLTKVEKYKKLVLDVLGSIDLCGQMCGAVDPFDCQNKEVCPWDEYYTKVIKKVGEIPCN